MSDAYSAVVRDHFEHPRNVGKLPCPDAVGQAENPVTGASLVLQVVVDGANIQAAVFRAQGCAATIACGSVLTEMLTGMSIDVARKLTRDDIENALDGLPPTRRHTADLAIDALRVLLDRLLTDKFVHKD